jgi:hypothetical protein
LIFLTSIQHKIELNRLYFKSFKPLYDLVCPEGDLDSSPTDTPNTVAHKIEIGLLQIIISIFINYNPSVSQASCGKSLAIMTSKKEAQTVSNRI